MDTPKHDQTPVPSLRQGEGPDRLSEMVDRRPSVWRIPPIRARAPTLGTQKVLMATKTNSGPQKAGKAKAAPKTVQPIPAGSPAITPYLRVRSARQALEFYKKAFGAEEKTRMAGPDGRVMHAEIQVFNTVVMLSDEFPDRGALSPESLKGSPVGLHVDGAIARAVAAGATVTMPAEDMFRGDRFGTIRDPFGHDWQLATHMEDVAAKEMQRRFLAMQAQQKG